MKEGRQEKKKIDFMLDAPEAKKRSSRRQLQRLEPGYSSDEAMPEGER